MLQVAVSSVVVFQIKSKICDTQLLHTIFTYSWHEKLYTNGNGSYIFSSEPISKTLY